MRMLFLLLMLGLSACGQGPNASDTDHSSIEDAYERWRAYGLSDYSIHQEAICFCLPPHAFTVHVQDGEITDLTFTEADRENLDLGEAELQEIGRQKARTVEEVFALIAAESEGAAVFEVEYDARYGYPTELYIDLDSGIADEEIRIKMSNLRF